MAAKALWGSTHMYMGLIQEIGIKIPCTAVFSIEHQRQSNTVEQTVHPQTSFVAGNYNYAIACLASRDIKPSDIIENGLVAISSKIFASSDFSSLMRFRAALDMLVCSCLVVDVFSSMACRSRISRSHLLFIVGRDSSLLSLPLVSSAGQQSTLFSPTRRFSAVQT
eukprot:scaffold20941_cov143-Skeletonema_marinoi.AAC.4